MCRVVGDAALNTNNGVVSSPPSTTSRSTQAVPLARLWDEFKEKLTRQESHSKIFFLVKSALTIPTRYAVVGVYIDPLVLIFLNNLFACELRRKNPGCIYTIRRCCGSTDPVRINSSKVNVFAESVNETLRRMLPILTGLSNSDSYAVVQFQRRPP